VIAWRSLAATAILAMPLASALAQTSAAPLPQPLPWGLDGAGKITVPDDVATLPEFGLALSRYAPKVDVIVSQSGQIDRCSAAEQLSPDAVVDQLCNLLKNSGRVDRASGLEFPASSRLRIQASALPRYTPKQPIKVVANSSDKRAVFAEIVEGADGSCGVVSRSLAEEFQDAICKAWVAKGRPGQPVPSGTGSVGIGVIVDDLVAPVFTRSFEWVFSEGGLTSSSLGDPDPGVTLTPAAGRLQVAIGEYPARALRAGMAAKVKVWVGFDRTGKVLSCRPVQSTNGSYLANTTCLTMLKRARFEFAADAPQFSGVRYVSKTVAWAVPQ